MHKFLTVIVALFGLSLVSVDADARRMGGGKNFGQQRQAVNPNQATPRTPAQQQQAAPAGAAAQQKSGASRWLGPLAGLALGAGLAALFFNNGLAGALMGILLLAAIVFGAVMLFRMIRGGARSSQAPLRYAGANPYGGSSPAPAPAAAPAAAPLTGAAAPHSVAATTRHAGAVPLTTQQWPADFDAEAFLLHARQNFVSLQAAHDRRDLSTIRDFLTPALYREIEAEVRAAGDAPQKTDVVTLNAEVIEVATEGQQYVVSVAFSGLIREEPGAEAQPFNEIWHLEKPVSGRSGWLVSGIQQA